MASYSGFYLNKGITTNYISNINNQTSDLSTVFPSVFSGTFSWPGSNNTNISFNCTHPPSSFMITVYGFNETQTSNYEWYSAQANYIVDWAISNNVYTCAGLHGGSGYISAGTHYLPGTSTSGITFSNNTFTITLVPTGTFNTQAPSTLSWTVLVLS